MATNPINSLLLRQQIEKLVKLPDADWALLEPWITEKTIEKNERLAVEGKLATEVGMVVTGALRHYYTRDGVEKTTYFYFENAFVGAYISCITGQPSALTIEALTDCVLLVFPYQILKTLFTESIYWERFGRLLAEWALVGVEERMAGLLMQTPEERYLQLLSGNKTKILERVPQHYIANYLGITPVSLSRIRNRILQK